jgi:hypothetical protein
LLLTYSAEAREYTFATVLFVDGTETLGIDGDAWCACCGHGTPPPVSGGAFSKAAARRGKLSTNGFLIRRWRTITVTPILYKRRRAVLRVSCTRRPLS